MTVLQKLNNTRVALQGHLTRVMDEADKALEESEIVGYAQTISEWRLFMHRLESQRRRFQEASEKILDSLEEASEIQAEIDKQVEINERYLKVELKLRDKIKEEEAHNIRQLEISRQLEADEQRSQAGSIQDGSFNQEHESSLAYQGLPKIKLPTFNGDHLEWRSFYDKFKATIDSRKIPDVTKLGFLMSAMKDEAKDVLSMLTCTEENYANAIDILKKRYADPRLLVGLYGQRLYRLPEVSEKNLKEFRKMVDTFESSLRDLQGLLEEVLPNPNPEVPLFPVYDFLLGPEFMLKLPVAMVREWDRTCETASDRFNLKKLMEFVKKELISLEAIQTTRSLKSESKAPESVESKRHDSSSRYDSSSNQRGSSSFRRHSSVGKSLVSTSRTQDCHFCSNHCNSAFQCPVFGALNVDQRWVRIEENHLCSNCLRSNHLITACRSKITCQKCNKKHHTLLHKEESSPQQKPSYSRTLNAMSSKVGKRSVLNTTLVHAIGFNSPFRALFDSGSDRSYIVSSAVSKINPPLVSRGLHQIEGFGASKNEERVHSTYGIKFKTRVSDPGFVFCHLVGVETICSPIEGIKAAEIERLLKDSDLLPDLADRYSDKPMKIDIVFGQDVLTDLILTEPPIKKEGIILTPTVFGYVIGGSIAGSTPSSSLSTFSHMLRASSVQVQPPIASLWELDSIGIPSTEKSTIPEIIPVKKEERYEVRIPWLGEERPSFSLRQAIPRAKSSYHRIPVAKRTEYVQTLETYHDLGILEEDPNPEEEFANYLPHHGVTNSKNKLRIVYNASAIPWKGASFNECCFAGPNLLEDLCQILLRFRTFTVPLLGDVEKAFLMVGIDPQDRSFLKIVWIDGNNRLRFSRFTRVCFGVNCGPYLLLVTIKHHLENCHGKNSDTIDRIKAGTYMDDLISGHDTDQKVNQLRIESTEIFREAGMNLRGFVSTPQAMQLWNAEGPPEFQKVLGIGWQPKNDTFAIKLKLEAVHSRRQALSVTSSVFDPLGFISPWIIKAKIFLQTLWEPDISWDDPLSELQQEKWNSLLDEVNCEPVFVIPRYVAINEKTQFLIFSDASSLAYSAVCYIKNEDETILFCSRARVKPLKPHTLTLPRLELMGVLLAVRLASFIIDALKISSDKFYFFTDSEITLHWIHGSSLKQNVFVKNRVSEIRSRFSEEKFIHVSGKDNPADLPSRGCTANQLINSDLWKYGPEFIRNQSWEFNTNHSLCTQNDTVELDFPIKDYSSFHKLKRVTAWIYRFCYNASSKDSKTTGPLSDTELQTAQNGLVRHSQRKYNSKEYDVLMGGDLLPLKSSLSTLHPVWCPTSNLIKVSPRHGGEAITFLPNESPLASMIILDLHLKLYHLGVPSTTQELLRNFCVPKPRKLVRKVLHGCVTCRRFQSKPIQSREGTLPSFRVTPSRPFSHTGLDHLGPLYTRSGQKVWILLFSCSVTRAIHLEAVKHLDSKETGMAIRRFCAQFGTPLFFISDNGTSFTNLAKVLKGLISWKCIPPGAPWWGGFWERMVQTVKRSFRKTLGNTSLSFTEIRTVLAEIQNCINRRPLHPACEDEDPITPAHFLNGLAPLLPDQSSKELLHDEDQLCRRWQYKQKTFNHLWSRWTKEYLPTLRNWRKGLLKQPDLEVGDVVFVEPPQPLPRSRWSLGKILNLHYSQRDGEVRAVDILIKGKIVERPISKLIPLEVPKRCSKSTPANIPLGPENACERSDNANVLNNKTECLPNAIKECLPKDVDNLLEPESKFNGNELKSKSEELEMNQSVQPVKKNMNRRVQPEKKIGNDDESESKKSKQKIKKQVEDVPKKNRMGRIIRKPIRYL